MSKPKEVVQAMYAAYGSGNMKALRDTLSDDIKWIYHGTDEIEHSGIYKGKKGVTKFFSDVNAHIDYLDFQPDKFIVEGNMVVVLGSEKQRIKKNSAILEQEWVQVYTVENELITRMEEFSNTSHAAKIHTK